MKVTQELIDKLVAYKAKHGITNMELGNRLNVSRAHIGRLLTPGSVAYVKDDISDEIHRLLGMTEAGPAPKVSQRDVFEVTYTGKAMEPVIGKGQTMIAEPMLSSDMKSNDIAVCRFVDKDKTERTVVRYLRPVSNGIELYAENEGCEAIRLSLGKIQWIARVLRPIRTISVGD